MTVALVANIARPISSAISTAFSADSYGLLSSYGLLGASANPDAVIEALFANSEVGAWYAPSDLTTMFQDRAGTTPVTADGQTVGKILDKSGRGNHATAPSDAARPLYKTDGTYHWLQFDGVDDSLSTAAINFTAVTNLSVFHGIFTNTPSTIQMPWAMGSNPDGTVGSFGYYLSRSVSGNNAFGAKTSLSTLVNGTPGAVTYKSVATSSLNQSAGTALTQATIRLNTVAQSMATLLGALMSPAVFDNLPFYIGYRLAGNDMRFNGNIYSLIIRGALSTTDEITATETWVNSKTGAWA